MKIVSIGIEKFRSIEKCWVEINEVCALVGSNNVGKSALLRALNCFFNYDSERENFIDGTHDYSNRAIPKIDVVFAKVSNKLIYKSIKDKSGNIHIRLTFDSTKKKKEKYQYKLENKFFELSNELLLQIKSDIQFVYIPTSRDYKETVLNEKSILKELLDVYLKKHTEKRNRLKPKIEEAVQYFNKNALKKISQDLQNLYPLSRKFTISIDYDKNDIDYHILLRDLCVKIYQGEKSFKMIDTGSGVQSMINIALYRLLSNLKHNNFVIGIEEPEINLHPQAQKELVKEFKTISDNVQIFFTTHSSVIIDQLKHSDILLFNRIEDKTRNFKTIVNQIPMDFWERYNLDYEHYFQFYQFHNSDFFYSNFVIVVEGKSEFETVNYLLSQSNINVDTQGISILSLDGVQDLKYPFYLLKHLQIPYLIIVDKDFFLPYSDDTKENSRTSNGFFKFKNSFQKCNLDLIKQMVYEKNDREALIEALQHNHTSALDLLEKYDIVCMRYNLEMDLVSTPSACKVYYKLFNIPPDEQSENTLLTNNKNGIKRPENIMKVVRQLKNQNLPYSFSRIKKIVKNKIKSNNL
jgi:predicted ATP-dependent endonuclease of OLD family